MKYPRRAAAVGFALLCSCAHELAAEPPADAKERRRVEIAACQNGALPPWLDDRALAASAHRDRWETLQFDPKESYAAGTNWRFQPPLPVSPPTGGAATRYAAIMNERRDFQARCELVRSARRGPALPSAR